MPFDTTRPDRQLIIGVDAMEWTLVKKWMAEGKLPVLQRIAEDGIRAELRSFADSVPDAVWTTFSYGVNPGKLEKYFYIHYDPKLGRLRYVHDHELKGKQFWMYLSEAGKRVGVVDVPHVPSQKIPNGFLVMNWGAHNNEHHLCIEPAALSREIKRRFGPHPVEDCERYNRDLRSRSRLRQDILRGVGKHGELFRWLMQSQPWEVFVCCFSAPHSAGHHFWGCGDPTHPDYEPGDPQGFEDTVEQTYRAIDSEIGKMVEMAGERTRVMVVAPHGMGQLSHASWNLNEMLELWGFATGDGRAAPPAERKGRVNPWRILKMVFPAQWQYAIKERLPQALQDQLLFLWYSGRSHFRGRRAFAVPNNEVVGAIRFSLKGRDRDGLVEPGAEYQRLRQEISDALRELTDPVTGRPVVRDVSYPRERFHGPFLDQLPDITVFWDSSFHWDAVHSPRFGTLHLKPQDRRTGSHTANSFLLACGPGFRAAKRSKAVRPSTSRLPCSKRRVCPSRATSTESPCPSCSPMPRANAPVLTTTGPIRCRSGKPSGPRLRLLLPSAFLPFAFLLLPFCLPTCPSRLPPGSLLPLPPFSFPALLI